MRFVSCLFDAEILLDLLERFRCTVRKLVFEFSLVLTDSNVFMKIAFYVVVIFSAEDLNCEVTVLSSSIVKLV